MLHDKHPEPTHSARIDVITDIGRRQRQGIKRRTPVDKCHHHATGVIGMAPHRHLTTAPRVGIMDDIDQKLFCYQFNSPHPINGKPTRRGTGREETNGFGQVL